MIDDRARTLRPSRTAPAWARSRSGTSGHLVASGAHHVPQRAEGVEALAVLLPGLGVAGPLLVEGAPPPPYAPPPPPPPEFELLLPPPPQPAASAAAARATSATSGRRGNPVPPRSAFLMTTQTLTSTPPSSPSQ